MDTAAYNLEKEQSTVLLFTISIFQIFEFVLSIRILFKFVARRFIYQLENEIHISENE